MLKRLVLVALLALAAARADAIGYTDVYFNPAESGWGFFLVQSNTTQFLALFIYGQDGKPTWYTGQLTQDAAGNFNGTLYALTGTYFPNPWQGVVGPNAVGTISFQPIDLYHATLTYTVNGVGTVTKAVQRQTLTPYALGGNYSGSMAGSISGCNDPTGNDAAFRGRYGLTVTQVADQSATLTFTFVDSVHNGLVCTLSGPLTHLGRVYQMANVQTSCTGGPNGPSGVHSDTIDGFNITGEGIEGYWKGNAGGGCNVSLHFAAVLNVNN
jgi:hypothetical protein